MLRVGLTGGIGSGKSTVARVFETLGIPVFYADEAAKRLMNTDPDLRQQLITQFGADVYHEKGLNRAYLASIVFNDPSKLAVLNSITHPATIADADNWMARQHGPYLIKEAALLFESHADSHLDLVIGVSAPLELRIKRAMDRDGLSRLEIENRIRRQMPEEEKMSRCNLILINDESSLLLPQVLAIHEKLLDFHR